MSRWQPLAIAAAALGPQCLASLGVFLGFGNIERAFSWAFSSSTGASVVGVGMLVVSPGDKLRHLVVPLSTIVVVERNMNIMDRAIQMKHCLSNLVFSWEAVGMWLMKTSASFSSSETEGSLVPESSMEIAEYVSFILLDKIVDINLDSSLATYFKFPQGLTLRIETY